MVTPVSHNLFEVDLDEKRLPKLELCRFNTTTTQLLYLCKLARLDVHLPVLFMHTRVREETIGDKNKFDRTMGYLKAIIQRMRRILNSI